MKSSYLKKCFHLSLLKIFILDLDMNLVFSVYALVTTRVDYFNTYFSYIGKGVTKGNWD